MRNLIFKIFTIIFLISILPTQSFAANIMLFENDEAEPEIVILNTIEGVPDDWLPLRAASEYLPIIVDWDEKTRQVVITGEHSGIRMPFTNQKRYSISNLLSRDDSTVIDGVTYCNPSFLMKHMWTNSFIYNGELWCCTHENPFDMRVYTSYMMMKLWIPDDYQFVKRYLTGGVKLASEEDREEYHYATAFIYPSATDPTCYIVAGNSSRCVLASYISHEAMHVHQARNGQLTYSNCKELEEEANMYEEEVEAKLKMMK